MKAGRTGVTTGTPKNIMFGAGTFHKNLTFTNNAWNFADSIIGATQGGSKMSIIPEFVDIEADGALVLVRGLKVKCGETATMETNALEMSEDIIKHAIIGQAGTSEDNTYNVLESKALLEDGDYLDNVAFVGQTLEGKNIIVIMENVLVTSGFQTDTKNKEANVLAYTFTCHADLDSDLDTLPYHIYYPKVTA